MNADVLLEHFHRLGDAPGAIPKLRLLVIDLALTGKLTTNEQKPSDAAKTGKLLKTGMDELTSSIQRTRWATSTAVDESERRFQAPEGWHWARLNDTGLYVNGVAFKPSDWRQSGKPILRIQNLSNPDAPINYAEGEFDEANMAPAGTILVSWSATLDSFIWKGETAVVNQHIFRVFPNEEALDKQFLYWLLKDSIKVLEAGEDMRGLTMRHIRRGPFLELPVAIPPLPEQHRIVAKVDELMALCDRLEAAQQEREQRRTRLTAASWQALTSPGRGPGQAESDPNAARFALEQLPALTTRPQQIAALRQTILDLAVRGRLVKQDEKDEAAAVLLRRIAKEKERLVKEKLIRKQTEYEALTEDELPCELPSNWTWLRVGQIGFTQTGTTPSSNNSEFFGNYIPFVKPGDMDGPTIDYTGPGISELGVQHSRLIPANSVLMVCVGSTIGKVNRCDRDICCNQQINTLTPYIAGLEVFMHYAMKALMFQKLVKSKAGMGTLPILSKGKWEQLPIPVPPLAEQRRIVAKVDELMRLCDALEAALVRGEAVKGRLLEAVLAGPPAAGPGGTQVKKYEEPEGGSVDGGGAMSRRLRTARG